MGTKTKNKTTKDYNGQGFVITREFDASRELVWKAWTDPKHLAQCGDPRGLPIPFANGMRTRVKQFTLSCARPMGGEFREIVAPERLVFTSGALDGKGKLLFEFLHTVTFTERKGKTMLTVQSRVLNTTADANQYIGGFEAGMTQSLERLAVHLATKNEPLIIERTFNAPVATVWKAITSKEDMKVWSFEIKEFKPEVGSEFQFFAEKDDVNYIHLCKITEIIPQKKMAYSWRYEGHEGDTLVTIGLFAEGKKTRLKLTHEGLETLPKTADFVRENFMQGWTIIIGTNLKQFVETASKGK
jgi:uncharacterized protein YndB with AHSA1/START domain